MENTESKSTIKNSWSLLTFARKFGTHLEAGKCTSPETVSRWMTNKVQPSVEQLYDIAKHLDVDVRDLLVSSK